MCLCVCVCVSGVIDEHRGAGMSPVSTRQLVQMFPKNVALIIITALLCSFPLLWVCGVQTSRAKCPASWLTTADSQALLEGIGSVRFLLVTARQNRKAGPVSLSVNVCVCVCVCVCV